jgi:DNA-binding NarL/FixJ family response regulator
MSAIRIVLFDDHPLIHEAVAHQLAGSEEFALVAAGTSGEEFEPLLEAHRPDIVLLDLAIPPRPGTTIREAGRFPVLPALRRLHGRYPATRFVILSGEFSPALLEAALESGASGYLLKDDGLSTQLADALRAVRRGGWFFSAEVGRHLQSTRSMPRQASPELTPRQLEVLRAIAANPELTHAEHARAMGISEDTVRNHLRTIYDRLQVTNLTAAVVRAVQAGLISLEQTNPPRD